MGMGGPMGGGRGGRRRPAKGEDTLHPLKVSLEDLFNGKTSKLQMRKNVICKKCNGPTNAVSLSRLQRRRRDDQREGPLQHLRRKEDSSRNQDPRSADRQRNERWSEDSI